MYRAMDKFNGDNCTNLDELEVGKTYTVLNGCYDINVREQKSNSVVVYCHEIRKTWEIQHDDLIFAELKQK